MRDPSTADIASRYIRRHVRKLQEASEMSPAEALDVIEEFQASISRVRMAMETLVPLLQASSVIETAGEVLVCESLAYMDVRRELVRVACSKHRGNKPDAADEIGVSLKTLYNWINADEDRL